MLSEKTFADHLKFQLKNHENHDYQGFQGNHQFWESQTDPAFLAQVIASTPVFNFVKISKTSYFKNPPIRPIHQMNESQESAFQILSLYPFQKLTKAFNLHELKSAYRAALLKTHPDQGGTAESFYEIRKSYEILKSLVTKDCEKK